MRTTLFILEDSECEPEIFTSAKETYDFMKEIFIEYGDRYGFDNEDIEECCKELYESYSTYEISGHFGSYLGERDLNCYVKTIDI